MFYTNESGVLNQIHWLSMKTANHWKKKGIEWVVF